MAKPQALFIELKIQNKFRYTCDIIEKLFQDGLSVLVYMDDKKKADTLDRQLWVWKQESFIPHTQKITSVSDDIEPIILTTNQDFPNSFDSLMLFDPIPDRQFTEFKYVIDFAEVYDPARIGHSRKRFKTMRDSDLYEMHFLKLGEFLSKYHFT